MLQTFSWLARVCVCAQFCAHFKLVSWSHLEQMKCLVSLLSYVLSERNSLNSWTGLSFLPAPHFRASALGFSSLYSFLLLLMLLSAAFFSSFSKTVLRPFLLLCLLFSPPPLLKFVFSPAHSVSDCNCSY